MRPPLSAIEPVRLPVAIGMRGVAPAPRPRASAAGRPACSFARAPAALRPAAPARAPVAPLLPGGGVVCCWVCCLASCLLLFHLRHADEILPADQHDRREHDGENGVLLIAHRELRPAVASRLQPPQRAPRIHPRSARTAAAAPRAGRSAHSHARPAAGRRPIAARFRAAAAARGCARPRCRLSSKR